MITVKQTNNFKKSLEIISSLIQETNIRFKEDGIYIQAIDKTQVLLIDFKMSKSVFETYNVEPNYIGVNLLEIYNIIARSFEKDKIQIDLKENFLEIQLNGQIQRKFNISYIETGKDVVSIPDIKFDVIFNINAHLLKEILKDASLIGNTIIFKIQNQKLIIETQGEKGKIETTIPKIKIKSKKDSVISKYSLTYLKNITKSMDGENDIVIKFSEDSPLLLEYNLSTDIKIELYLSSMLI